VICRAMPPMFFSTAHLMLRIRSVTLNHLHEAASCPEHLNDTIGQWPI
jgi:hypothetical protein